ncbi:hypothetical protein FACS1894200_12010 [Spirochaetia bacterium]|nr:hypothetical protein FACS1894200_12010 [Spirochaetia bacterium]
MTFTVITTTTRLEHYGSGNSRQTHVYFKLPAGTAGLIQDSVVDFTQDFQEIHKNGFEQGKSSIHKEGSLKQDNINTLVKYLERAQSIPKITKKTIYECLRKSGFIVNIR